jgi:N-methylhydantoinase A
LAEVGAGGGSVIWIDAGGALQIGPHSAGASPGPVCYDLGGTLPTLTDANVVLGYINPDHLVGGALKLDASKARSVIAGRVAEPLGMTVEEAAWGAHLIAGSNMIRAIKAVSSERGRDPRDYALVAFGGNGPLFAAVMAAALMIRRVVIPPSAGVFSSYGLLYSEVAYHFTKTRKALLGAIDPAEIGAILGELEGEARARLAEDGFVEDRIAIERAAALHYQGQSFELEVPVLGGVIDRAVLTALDEAFGVEHEKTYGHRAGVEEPVELVTLKVVGRGVPDVPRATLAAKADLPASVLISQPLRQAYFGPVHGWRDTDVVNRADLDEPRQGPCIVEEYDATCVIPPGSAASLDRCGNIVIDVPVTAHS